MNNIAYCGYNCDECPVAISTKNNDKKMKESLVKKYSTNNYEITIDDINCLGCLIKDVSLFKFCNECNIRQCCIDKNILNCGYCNNYPCNKLDIISADSKKILDIINKNINC